MFLVSWMNQQYHDSESFYILSNILMLDFPIGINILMKLQTHQRASTRARAYAHDDYENRLPIWDVWNTAY